MTPRPYGQGKPEEMFRAFCRGILMFGGIAAAGLGALAIVALLIGR